MIDFGFFREIFQSINKNKLRTLLSGFTVAFAIMLFAILFGVANGLQNSFNSEFAGDANNSIFIFPASNISVLTPCSSTTSDPIQSKLKIF